MQHSSNRNLRKSLHDAFYSRASYINEQFETNNSEVIKAVLNYRKTMAKLFGFENYAQFSMETKAAVSVDNVIDLIDKYYWVSFFESDFFYYFWFKELRIWSQLLKVICKSCKNSRPVKAISLSWTTVMSTIGRINTQTIITGNLRPQEDS